MTRQEMEQVRQIAREIAKEEIALAIESAKAGPVSTEDPPEKEEVKENAEL